MSKENKTKQKLNKTPQNWLERRYKKGEKKKLKIMECLLRNKVKTEKCRKKGKID